MLTISTLNRDITLENNYWQSKNFLIKRTLHKQTYRYTHTAKQSHIVFQLMDTRALCSRFLVNGSWSRAAVHISFLQSASFTSNQLKLVPC